MVPKVAGPQRSGPPATPAVSTGESGRQRPPPQLPRPLSPQGPQVGVRAALLAPGRGAALGEERSLGPRHGRFEADHG